MVEKRRLQFALAQLEGKLHTALGEKRCGCGQCGHWVAVAARRAGIPRAAVLAALPMPAKAERPRRRRPAPMQARICDSSTVRIRGAATNAGMAALLARFHDE